MAVVTASTATFAVAIILPETQSTFLFPFTFPSATTPATMTPNPFDSSPIPKYLPPLVDSLVDSGGHSSSRTIL